jgi:putative nucleotidyltransferase with HDIG domain
MPGRVRIYIAACAGAAIVVAAAVVRADHSFSWQIAAGFGILCFVSENFSVTTRIGTTYSVSFVLTIAAMVAAGPAEAVVATLFGTMSLRDFRTRPPLRHVFNASQLVLATAAAGLTYQWIGGGAPAGHLHPAMLAAILAATAVNFPINTVLVSCAVAFTERRCALHVWRAQYAALGPTYLAFALLGLLLGVLYRQMGWGSVLFLLMPLLVARHAFQAAITMQSAYDETVHGLIGAIEAKDPYTSGHAERVSRLAEMTARAYGLSTERCRAIRYAALMHDVGKLTVRSVVLQKPGKLTPEEYEHMKSHPTRGVEIIGDIDLLQEALDGVRHHHERIDGSGYPDGLMGDEIPLVARLITVADAFDSMTSTRVYRTAKTMDEALAELHKYEGRMFDERALQALESAIRRNGWEPAPEAGPELSEAGVEDVDVASIS